MSPQKTRAAAPKATPPRARARASAPAASKAGNPGPAVTAALGLVRRVVDSWREGDADAFTTVFAPNGIVVLSGAVMKGRDEIRSHMTTAFAGEWAGTHVYGAPVDLRHIGEDAMLLVSEGGPYRPGATEVPVENAIRAMWFFVKKDGEWLVEAYANTPARVAVPLPKEL